MSDFLAACIVAGMPLLLATVGEIITEKSGSLNLGVEGMMLMGAVMGFFTAQATGNAALAILAALAAGGTGALIFAFLTVSLRTNQVVTGLTLTIFGTGFARFVGKPMLGTTIPGDVGAMFAEKPVPGLSSIPVIGPVFFEHDFIVYAGYFIFIIAGIYLYKTRFGLNLRAVGENTGAADASGVNINIYKYAHIIAGGMLCGLAGAYLSLVRIPIWQTDVVNGRGWIAVALVIFASWNPIKAFFGAILFGGLSILGLKLQAMGIHISQYLVDMVPYIATIAIVVLSTRRQSKENSPPGDLGVNYFREER